MIRNAVRVMVAGALVLAFALPAAAQAKVSVIDVQRVVTESDPGKEVMQRLRSLTEAKAQQGQSLQQELATLQDQFNKQRFTVSEARQAEMQKEIEDKQISIRRFQDDAQREVAEAQRRELGSLEERIMPIIDQIGKEQGLTMIFNKFQSGLVYADESIDITDEAIRRFNRVQ